MNIETLDDFLTNWCKSYEKKIKKITLFCEKISWTFIKKELFVKQFYHVRGHFYRFLWVLGNNAPTKWEKELILTNIREEFGASGKSHEEYYIDFAHCLNIDLKREIISNEHHTESIKAFNEHHIAWLINHSDWESKFSAFAAYEKLDNIDYACLLVLARSMNIDDKGLQFFKIHNNADHFDRLYERLLSIWSGKQEEVIEAFNFIANNQIKMWEILANVVIDENKEYQINKL